MSNINRMDHRNSVDISMSTDGAAVGFDRQVSPNLAVGATAGTADGAGTVGARLTTNLFPDKNFSPFATLGVNLGGIGGAPGLNPNVSLKGGAEYRFNSGFGVGAFVGVERGFGGTGTSPWGATAGISAAIHF